MTSWTHVIAVVVGAARPDGDVYAHFGSLLGFIDHAAVAEQLGLVRPAPEPVTEDAPEVVLTDTGQAFVEQFGLAGLPPGRTSNWQLRHAGLLDPAARTCPLPGRPAHPAPRHRKRDTVTTGATAGPRGLRPPLV